MMDKADTVWVLICAALVLLMTPGLAFFYGGLVRRKNVLSILMQCFTIMCLLSLQWVLFGYSLAFGPDVKGIIGDLSWAGLRDVSGSLPHWVYRRFGVPAFDLELGPDPDAKACIQDGTTRQMLDTYRERHYGGLVRVLESLNTGRTP